MNPWSPPPGGAPAVPRDEVPRFRRINCGLGALAWLVVFGWLWLGAPWIGRLLGLAWFGVGLMGPWAWLVSFAAALPWFGNNPGGGHHLYLVEMGLIGLVTGHLVLRAVRIRPWRPTRLDPWITLLVAYTWMRIIPTWPWYLAELQWTGRLFAYSTFMHYGTSEVFGLQVALKLTLAAGLFVTLRDDPPNPVQWRRFAGLAFGVFGASALLGLLNYLGWLPLTWWRGENPDILKFGYRRLQSLYWHSGWFAQYAAFAAPLAVAWALTTPHWSRRFAGIGLALALLGIQLLTYQRGGWVALTAGYVVVLALAGMGQDRPLRRMLVQVGALAAALMVMLGLLAAILPSFLERMMALATLSDRTEIWRSALALAQRNWVFGVGPGNYFTAHGAAFPYGHEWWALDKVTAHNLFLHTLTERGLIGLALLVGLIVQVMRAGWRRIRSGEPARRMIDLGLAGAGIALLVYGLTQYIFYIRVIELAGWVVMGGLAGGLPALNPSRPWRRRGFAALMVALALWTLLVLLVFARPYRIWVEDAYFDLAGESVELALPEGADTVHFALACVDPTLPEAPVKFTVRRGEDLLEVVRIEELGRRWVELTLKPPARPGEVLRIEASRTWSPWGSGARTIPATELGVLVHPGEAALAGPRPDQVDEGGEN